MFHPIVKHLHEGLKCKENSSVVLNNYILKYSDTFFALSCDILTLKAVMTHNFKTCFHFSFHSRSQCFGQGLL